MQNMWKTILDGLSYKDLAGKRQPRAYTILSLLVLFLLTSIGGFIFLSRFRLMSQVKAEPVPVSVPIGPVSQSTNLPPTMTVYDPGCPTDPEQWSLADAVISQNYKLIQPACVYAGLEHTIAWVLALRNGYGRAEAARSLDFEAMPLRQLDHVEALGNTKGPQSFPVHFIPPHPDFTEWHVDSSGNPATTYALRGCYRTSSIVGNRIETWGGDYPVICIVIEDAENTYSIYQLEGHTFTSPATPTRSFLLFGYAGDGLWVWLGTRDDPKLPIDDPARFASDRLTTATLYDSRPWDLEWWKIEYGINMKPLPENWQEQTGQAEMQAILAALNNDGVQQ